MNIHIHASAYYLLLRIYFHVGDMHDLPFAVRHEIKGRLLFALGFNEVVGATYRATVISSKRFIEVGPRLLGGAVC